MTVDNGVRLASLFGAVAFVLGLHMMNSPATARRGNQLSAFGMLVAIVAVLVPVPGRGPISSTRRIVPCPWPPVGSVGGLVSRRAPAQTPLAAPVLLHNR